MGLYFMHVAIYTCTRWFVHEREPELGQRKVGVVNRITVA